MARQLPEKWISGKKKSLNVKADLNLKGDYPSSLTIYKRKETELLDCRFLPSLDSDTRKLQGRSREGINPKTGKKWKRRFITGRTGCSDPYEAAKSAISWSNQELTKLKQIGEKERYNSRHNLHYYWEKWYSKYCANPSTKPRGKADKLNMWNGKGWGIGEQKWSHKSVDDIDYSDIQEYFDLLHKRGGGGKGSNAVQKGLAKSLINKLFDEARQSDFKQLQPLIFPPITRITEEVEHFKEDEWQRIVMKVMELSGYELNKQIISEQEYQNLQWGRGGTDYTPKNWIDFYDCLMLNYYFYLRPRDIPKLKSEWFSDKGDRQVRLFLEEVKDGRKERYETAHYREKGYDYWKKLNWRKPKGYLGMPFYQRIEGNEGGSRVGECINRMLKEVCDLCKIKKRNKIVWGIIRHTAFRLTLEDNPDLGSNPMALATFGRNGHTSPDMLWKHYLKSIESEKTALKAQKQIKSKSYELIKRVSLDE